MGTTLTGTTPQDTYDSLIKVTDNGPISGTAKYLSDGLGNDSVLALSNARVGVGTASPSFPLHVLGSAGTIARITDGTSHIDLYSGSGLSEISAATTMLLSTSGTEKVRITSAGNVGIGTSAPAELLELAAATDPKIRFLDIGNIDAKIGIISSTALGFEVNGLERMRIVSDGTLRLSTNSGGIQFNGDTAAANALDDYEEGTFTPTIIGTTTAGTATYGGGQSGLYTKIGRMVYVSIYLSYSGGTGTGDLRIAGLPFTIAAADVPSFSIGAMSDIVLTALNVPVVSGVPSATQLSIQQLPVGGGTQTSVTYDGTGVIVMSGFYQV
jgi:hypothetical protein